MDKEFHRQKSREHYLKYKDKYNARSARNREINKQISAQYKEAGCKLCPETEPVCLDFHHLDPATKETIVAVLRGATAAKLKAEIDKCVVLCSNCHRKLHAGIICL